MSEIDEARLALAARFADQWPHATKTVEAIERLCRAILSARPQPSAPERPARKFDAQLSFGGATQESLAPPGFRLRRRDERCQVCAVEADLPCEEPRHTIVDWRHFLVAEERPAEKCLRCGGRGWFVIGDDEEGVESEPCPDCSAPRESDPSATTERTDANATNLTVPKGDYRPVRGTADGIEATTHKFTVAGVASPSSGGVAEARGSIRTLRKVLGINMGEVADYTGWPVSRVSDIERGIGWPPTVTEVVTYMNALGDLHTPGTLPPAPAEAASEGSDEPSDDELGEIYTEAYEAVVRHETMPDGRECRIEGVPCDTAACRALYNAGRASLEKRIEAYERFVEWTRLEAPARWSENERTHRVKSRIDELEEELSAAGTKEAK